eukprot:3527676-Prymnesium_polylepis.2
MGVVPFCFGVRATYDGRLDGDIVRDRPVEGGVEAPRVESRVDQRLGRARPRRRQRDRRRWAARTSRNRIAAWLFAFMVWRTYGFACKPTRENLLVVGVCFFVCPRFQVLLNTVSDVSCPPKAPPFSPVDEPSEPRNASRRW